MSNNIHACHISTVHPADDTRIFFKECRGLSRKGLKVDLLIPTRDTDVSNGVTLIPLKIYHNRFSRIFFGSIRALLQARKTKADIYHIHDPELIPLGLLLRITGKRVIYDMHENVPEQIKEKQWISSIFRGLLSTTIRVFERISLRFLSVIMAEHSYAKAYSWLGHKETVLNLPDVSRLTPMGQKLKCEDPKIGYIGGVTNNRGAGITVEALARLRTTHPDLRFLCIGGVSPEVQKDSAFQKGIHQGWLEAPGRLSPEEGWPRIGECHIGVAILKRTGNHEHSYPTKLFEYMAMGLPVVTSDFELYREVVEKHECGICVDPDNVDDLASAIEYLLNNPNEASIMGQRGQEAAKTLYNWDTELDKLLQFYSEVLIRQGKRSK